MPAALSLPDLDALDHAALKALFLSHQEKYAATLTSRTSEIERLMLLVEKLQRMLFGTKSEKVLRQIKQLELQLEELHAASAVEELQVASPAERPIVAKPFRRPLPEHLPREVHTHMPDRPSGDKTAPAVWFAYSPDRKGERPKLHLKNYRGALQADAYAGFNHLYEGGTIYEAACWAHARRKFHEIHIAHASPITAEAIQRIAALYAIEAEIRGIPADLRKTVRQARARPLLDGMRLWMETTLGKLSRKSDTAAAIRYALSRWKALTRYADDGHLEIDNNAAERALRVVALGRKNFLFAGSDAGGERAAAIYSLLGSAKLNGLDPELYLHHVLQRIADHPVCKITDPLPWNLSLLNPISHS